MAEIDPGAYTLFGTPNNTSDSLAQSGIGAGSPSNSAGVVMGPSADPSAARLAAAGLATGAENVLKDIAGRVFNVDFRNNSGAPINTTNDWRIRISMQPKTANLFYNGSERSFLTGPLAITNGVVFPYTPQIQVTHQAKYEQAALTHSNYASYFYQGSEIQNIQINGDFTVQNVEEGQYLLAVIHFFRACTKMFFGKDPLAGTPPPMVFLDGYGPHYFPHVPCVVTQFSHTMPSDVDYVECWPYAENNSVYNFAGSSPYIASTRLPTMSSVNVTLQPVYSRRNIAENFELTRYGGGYLVQSPTSDKGGFI